MSLPATPTSPSPIAPKWRIVSRAGPMDGQGVLLSALLWDDKTLTSPPGLIFLGINQTFWTSHDGVDWTAATAGYNAGLEYRQEFCATATLTGVRLFGGDTRPGLRNDLWTYECGTPEPGGPKPSLQWKREPDPGVPARYGANMATTRIPNDDPVRYGDCSGDFILGGTDTWVNFQDVWCLPPVSGWAEVTVGTPYLGSMKAATIAWRGCLWRFGGVNETSRRATHEVYASGDDGATWYRPFTEVPWSARTSCAVVALGDCLVLLGGNNGWNLGFNDCWIFDGSYWTQGPSIPDDLRGSIIGFCTEAPLRQTPMRRRAWFITHVGEVAALEL